MKRVFYFSLFSLFVFLIYSCNRTSKKTEIFGVWYSHPEYYSGHEEYVKFTENGLFETKALRLFYLSAGYHSIEGSDTMPQKMSFNYAIDSVDEIGGVYYRIYSNDNSFSRRKYAIVDNNILFDCDIKPKPSDENYIHNPKVYINNLEYNKKIESRYFNQNLIFSDYLGDGEYYIYYNKLSGKSNIKKENSNLVITNKGIIEVDEFFDIRYFALKKYKAYKKQNEGLIEIPVIYYSDFIGMDYLDKKKFVNKLCLNDNSKCLFVSRLNPGRWYFIKEFGRKLKGGNILSLKYISKKNLFKIFDRQYYGTNN